MIIAWGLLILSTYMMCSILYGCQVDRRLPERMAIRWFLLFIVIDICSAQYIWG